MYKCITQVCSVFKEKIYIHAGMLFGGISVVLRPICVQMASNKWWSTENVDWEFETCFSSGAPMGEIQGSDSDKTGPWGTFTAKWNHRSYFLRNCEGGKKKNTSDRGEAGSLCQHRGRFSWFMRSSVATDETSVQPQSILIDISIFTVFFLLYFCSIR